MNDICFELSSSWQSDFDTTPIKLQRIRHRQRLPPLFLRKLRGKVRENVGQVANAYRSKHMCALSRPAVIQTCLSSSATPILIRPEELRIGLLGSYQVFQLFEAHKRPVFKDLFRHVNPLEQIIKLFCSAAGVSSASEPGQMFANLLKGHAVASVFLTGSSETYSQERPRLLRVRSRARDSCEKYRLARGLLAHDVIAK
jgi:hypothetical protein